jgi:hypothetical protein
MKEPCSNCGKMISWEPGSITSGSPEAAFLIFGQLCNSCSAERAAERRHEEMLAAISDISSGSKSTSTYSVPSGGPVEAAGIWGLLLMLAMWYLAPPFTILIWLKLFGESASPSELANWANAAMIWVPGFNLIALMMFAVMVLFIRGFASFVVLGTVAVCVVGIGFFGGSLLIRDTPKT